MKHLQFSKGTYLFLEDLRAAEEQIDIEFSYKFGKNLKMGQNKSQQELNKEANIEEFLQIQNNLKNQSVQKVNDDDDIEEEFERDEDDEEIDDMELKEIENIREEELRKSIILREEDRLAEYLKKRQELEQRLLQKEEKIKELTSVITMFDSSEVMAISNDDDEPFKPVKMSKAEYIMAQVDLDVIESHGSQEMSTHHFKDLNIKNPVHSN